MIDPSFDPYFGFETQRRHHQNSKNRGISGPTKRTYILQNFEKKKKERTEVGIYRWFLHRFRLAFISTDTAKR